MSTTISTGPALPPDEAARRAQQEFEEAGSPLPAPDPAAAGHPAAPGPADLPPPAVPPPVDAGAGREVEPGSGR